MSFHRPSVLASCRHRFRVRKNPGPAEHPQIFRGCGCQGPERLTLCYHSPASAYRHSTSITGFSPAAAGSGAAMMCRKSGPGRGVIARELAAGSIKPNVPAGAGRWVLTGPDHAGVTAVPGLGRRPRPAFRSAERGAHLHVCRASGTWGARVMIETAAARISRAGVSPRQAITASVLAMLCLIAEAGALGAVPAVSSVVSRWDGACSPPRRRSRSAGGAGAGQGPAAGGSAPAPGPAFLLAWPGTPGPGGRIRCVRPAGHARRAGSSATRSSGGAASRVIAFTPGGVLAGHRIGAVNDGLLGVEQRAAWKTASGFPARTTYSPFAVCFPVQPGAGSGNQYPLAPPALPLVLLWPMLLGKGLTSSCSVGHRDVPDCPGPRRFFLAFCEPRRA